MANIYQTDPNVPTAAILTGTTVTQVLSFDLLAPNAMQPGAYCTFVGADGYLVIDYKDPVEPLKVAKVGSKISASVLSGKQLNDATAVLL